MSDAGSGVAPAGWYEDGVAAGQERYWDGAQWTDQFRPLAPPPPPPPAVPAAPAAEAAAPVEQPVAAAPAPAEQPPAGAPTYPAYQPAAGATAYPAYQPAQAAPRAPRKGLSTGAIVGIVVGAVVVVAAAIVLILGFTAWGWGGGAGGASNAQQQQFLSDVKSSGDVTASDAVLLDAGNKLCEAGRTIVAGDYLGGMTKYLDVFSAELDLVTLGNVAMYAMTDLCPDVQRQLEELGQSFL